MVFGSSNNESVCCECQGQRAVSPGPSRRDGASEAETPLGLRLAVRLSGFPFDYKDVEMGILVQEMLPQRCD